MALHAHYKIRGTSRPYGGDTVAVEDYVLASNKAFRSVRPDLEPAPEQFASRACSGLDTEMFFVTDPSAVAAAVEVCIECPLMVACFERAVAQGEYGVWGGQLLHRGKVVVPRAVGRPRQRSAVRAA